MMDKDEDRGKKAKIIYSYINNEKKYIAKFIENVIVLECHHF